MAGITAPPAPGSFAVAPSGAQECTQRLAAFLDPLRIEFDAGSTFVDARHAPLLEQIADRIATCPGAQVTVAGHADGSGTDAVNTALSWDRADRTLNLLVSLGAPPSAVEAAGLGAAMPLSQGSDEENAADRRVEFILKGQPAH